MSQSGCGRQSDGCEETGAFAIPATSTTLAAIDQVFSDWNKPDAPGVAAGVVRDGEALYTRCFGLANLEHRVPITPSTVFDIASMTKQFTAFAVLLLVRDGKLDPDDEVRNYIPELPAYDPPVRVRHCLYHTSGLIDWLDALSFAGPTFDYCTRGRAVQMITAQRETMFPAGRAHSYSNTGYVLLAWIVARVSGKPLPEFLKARVFAPLGMSASAFHSHPEDFLPDQAQGYEKEKDGRLCRVSWPCDVCGDGRMFSSIGDMILWLQSFTAKEIGGAELFHQFFAPGHLDNGQELRYAAGWEIDHYREHRPLRHGGIGPGFQSHIAWFPEAALGIAILGNVFPCRPWLLANRVLDAVLDQGLPKRRPAISRDAACEDWSAECDDVSGRYFTATGLPVLVERDGDGLVVDIWLWRRSNDRFREDDSGDSVTFHRDGGGNVTHFTMATADGAAPRMHSPIRHAVKFESVEPGPAELAAFEGRYICDELVSVYTIVAGDGGLTARHLRCFDWHLRPIKPCVTDSFESDFTQESAWPGRVTFERDDGGEVIGFRVRGMRIRLFFRRFAPAL